MDRAPAQELRIGETGNHPKHSLLLARAKASLKADEIPHTPRAVLHTELSDRVRVSPRPRVAQPNGLHRTEAEGLASAARHLFDRHAALEVRDRVEVVALVLIPRDERVEKRLVLVAGERTVHICP